MAYYRLYRPDVEDIVGRSGRLGRVEGIEDGSGFLRVASLCSGTYEMSEYTPVSSEEELHTMCFEVLATFGWVRQVQPGFGVRLLD